MKKTSVRGQSKSTDPVLDSLKSLDAQGEPYWLSKHRSHPSRVKMGKRQKSGCLRRERHVILEIVRRKLRRYQIYTHMVSQVIGSVRCTQFGLICRFASGTGRCVSREAFQVLSGASHKPERHNIKTPADRDSFSLHERRTTVGMSGSDLAGFVACFLVDPAKSALGALGF